MVHYVDTVVAVTVMHVLLFMLHVYNNNNNNVYLKPNNQTSSMDCTY